jgi:hypothetical protein
MKFKKKKLDYPEEDNLTKYCKKLKKRAKRKD